MGAKRIAEKENLLLNGDMSGNITTDATNILYMDRAAYQLIWTGTPVGDFSIEVSLDGIHWSEADLSRPISASGSANDAVIEIETGAKLVRLKYTATSGTGSLKVSIVAKSISG